MRTQIYGTSLNLKNGLMDFNEIWYKLYSFIGVDYATLGMLITCELAHPYQPAISWTDNGSQGKDD